MRTRVAVTVSHRMRCQRWRTFQTPKPNVGQFWCHTPTLSCSRATRCSPVGAQLDPNDDPFGEEAGACDHKASGRCGCGEGVEYVSNWICLSETVVKPQKLLCLQIARQPHHHTMWTKFNVHTECRSTLRGFKIDMVGGTMSLLQACYCPRCLRSSGTASLAVFERTLWHSLEVLCRCGLDGW